MKHALFIHIIKLAFTQQIGAMYLKGEEGAQNNLNHPKTKILK